MKTITPATFIIAYLTLICGCQQAFKRAFVDAGEIDKQLVNYALPENGAMIFVSQDNPNHPASTLTDGVTSSENWDSGEGWEVDFDGAYEYGGYTEVGESERLADFRFGEQATRQRADGSQSNYKSRGSTYEDNYTSNFHHSLPDTDLWLPTGIQKGLRRCG
jgi:hypothetical protein